MTKTVQLLLTCFGNTSSWSTQVWFVQVMNVVVVMHQLMLLHKHEKKEEDARHDTTNRSSLSFSPQVCLCVLLFLQSSGLNTVMLWRNFWHLCLWNVFVCLIKMLDQIVIQTYRWLASRPLDLYSQHVKSCGFGFGCKFLKSPKKNKSCPVVKSPW